MKVQSNSVLLLTLSLVITLGTMPSNASAQQSAPDEVVRINADLVLLDAQVIDKKTGRPVDGLTKEDFELYDNGVRQQISYFSRDELPLSILLLLDISGSVRPIISQIRDGALNALQRLKPEDEVAVMAFATRAELAHGFTRDRQAIVSKINEVSEEFDLGKETFLHQAVHQAAVEMSKASNPASRRVVIVVTDNMVPPGNAGPMKGALVELFESGTVVYGLIVRTALIKALNIMTLGLIRGVDKYADQTGGDVLKSGREEVATKLAEIIARLRTRYSLGYKPSDRIGDGKFRPLKLRLSARASSQKGKPVVRTKRGYYFRR